jgi:hypothetical protein
MVKRLWTVLQKIKMTDSENIGYICKCVLQSPPDFSDKYADSGLSVLFFIGFNKSPQQKEFVMKRFVSSFSVGCCSVFSYLFLGLLVSFGKTEPFVKAQFGLYRRALLLSGPYLRSFDTLCGALVGIGVLALFFLKVRLSVMGIDLVGSLGLILLLNMVFNWSRLRMMDLSIRRHLGIRK